MTIDNEPLFNINTYFVIEISAFEMIKPYLMYHIEKFSLYLYIAKML